MFTSIAAKLLAAFSLSGLLIIGLAAWVSFTASSTALSQASFERLTAVRAAKQRQIEKTFKTMLAQARGQAESDLVRQAMMSFSHSFHAAVPNASASGKLHAYYEEEYLPRLNARLAEPATLATLWPEDALTRHWQERYIAGNPYPVGAKDNLVAHKDSTAYDTAHALYHPQFRRMIERFGFYDLFLIDARSGHIVYSVFKETDYATRLGDGPYRGSNLAELFSRALKSPSTEFSELVDYRPYSPSYASPAAFIAAPIYDGDNKIGVLAVQVPINEINQVMTGGRNWRREGLGESGETYLVGEDFLMRSDSRFLTEDPKGFYRALAEFKRPQPEIDAIQRLGTTILTLSVKSDAAQDALLGNTGARIIHDYRGIPVLSSYTPIDVPGLHWALLSEIDESEAFAPIEALRQRMLLLGLALVLPMLGLGALLAGGFALPVRRLLAGVERVRRGELDQRVEVRSRDELGELTTAFNAMAAELQQTTVSKDYVDSVFHSMNDVLLVSERRSSDAELVIIDANPHALRVLQRSRMELIGQPLGRVLQAEGEMTTWTAESTPPLIASEQKRAVKGRLLPRETAPIPVLISLSALSDEAGALKRLVAVAHDITEQKQAQEALTRANSLKDAFLANTSHELRTPLNGIIGMGEGLIEGVSGPVTPAQRKNLNMIVSSGRRLSNLINDILDFSKLRHRSLDLQRKPVDLHALTELVFLLIRPLVSRDAVELINRIDPAVPLVHGDENRLQQVLYNLIGNGIKFTAEGRVQVSATVCDGMLAVTVTDTGIGIQADKFAQIFESFEQGDGSTAREYGGTGLGLSITRQLVELHGGAIAVASEVGKGSSFTFTVPRSDVPRSEFVAAVGERNVLTGVKLQVASEVGDTMTEDVDVVHGDPLNYASRILIVDDEPVNLQVLYNYLSLEKYSVVQAAGGQEALDLVHSAGPFHLIILDIMMPRMSGYECCRKLRETYPANDLPVLLLTAKNQVSDLVAGFESGANDFLTKPFSRHELISRVRTHVNLTRIHAAASRFVPREFLHFLQKDSLVDVKPGDQVQKLMTVLFADIRGFTSMSGQMTLQQTFDFINEYFRQMEPCIKERHGFIDKFIGDAIMALFQGADDAVRAAVAMVRQLDTWNMQRANQGAPGNRVTPVGIGIGLHTGGLLLGTVGVETRLEGTVISDAVNLASRIEALTRDFGTSLLITEDTYANLRDPSRFSLRQIDSYCNIGMTQMAGLYEVLDAESPEQRTLKLATLAEYQRAQSLYRKREFAAAASGFETVLAANPADGPAQLMMQRCQRLAASGVPLDWLPALRLEKHGISM